MDLRRLRAGELLAAVSGVALLVSLFLPWYARGLPGGGVTLYGPATLTGWESLSAIDVVLALVAVSGVLIAIVTVTQPVPALPVATAGLGSLIGLVGVIVVLLRIVDIPSWASGREWGPWLALAGACGIIAGALLAMRDEIRPPGVPVEIESLPAPRP
jgi:hypothetical protein